MDDETKFYCNIAYKMCVREAERAGIKDVATYVQDNIRNTYMEVANDPKSQQYWAQLQHMKGLLSAAGLK